MGVDNVAVHWPRTGRFYDPVPATEFADFEDYAQKAPPTAGPAAALANHIARTGIVRAGAYLELVDLILDDEGTLLAATEITEEDDDPVIDPSGCGRIAEKIDMFVAEHDEYGESMTYETITAVLRRMHLRLASSGQVLWLDSRLDALRDEHGQAPQWCFTRLELTVLAEFYRRCTERSFAVYADA